MSSKGKALSEIALYELLTQVKCDITAMHPLPGFGARVSELRNRLVAARSRGDAAQLVLLAEARVVLSELDSRYFGAIESRIKCELSSQAKSAQFLKDVTLLHRFIHVSRSVWEVRESDVLRRALALFSELELRGFTDLVPQRNARESAAKPAQPTGPPPASGERSKQSRPDYFHNATLDDDFDDQPRLKYISGGAFEMNRRRH